MIFQSYNKIGHLASKAGYSSSKSTLGLVVLSFSSQQVKPIMVYLSLFSPAL